MLKIDFHCHMVINPDWYPPMLWNEFMRVLATVREQTFEERMAIIEKYCDPEGMKLLGDLHEAKIDKAVIFPSSDYDYLGESTSVSIEEKNQKCYQLGAEHPEFIPFFNIDPRRKNAAPLFLEGLDKYGVKGLKLLPGAGFYPQDKIVYPLYEIASDRKVPVLCHTGPNVSPMKSKFSDPMNFDEVAADFPELTIVMAHSSYGYWPFALSIAQKKPNIYLELSGWQNFFLTDQEYFYKGIRTITNMISSKRILFGTDYPWFPKALRHAKFIEALKNPPEKFVDEGLNLKEDEVTDILGGNACRLLGIE